MDYNEFLEKKVVKDGRVEIILDDIKDIRKIERLLINMGFVGFDYGSDKMVFEDEINLRTWGISSRKSDCIMVQLFIKWFKKCLYIEYSDCDVYIDDKKDFCLEDYVNMVEILIVRVLR